MTRNTISFQNADGIVTISRRSMAQVSSREYFKKPRVYVSTDEAFDLAEDLVNRTRRPYTAWRKSVQRLFMELGVPVDLDGMRWSQYAGCSCPCSPGFVLKRQETIFTELGPIVYYDIWVELTGAPKVDESKAPRQLALL